MAPRADKPLLRVLAGEILDPPPIWLMRQAGRYLPEYREIRAKAGSFLDLCFNPELAAEVSLQPIRRFGFDAAIIFADILLVPHGLGQKVWFEEGEGPRLEPITDAAGLAKLSTANLLERVAPVFETVRCVKAALPDEVALIGFAGAPWTVATYMIAGRGMPDQAAAKLKLYADEGFWFALSDLLVDATVEYLSAQIEAGAEVIQLFDTWAGGLGPELFSKAVLAPTSNVVRALRRRHPAIPIIGFPRGIGTSLDPYVRATGVDAVSIGTGENAQVVNEMLDTKVVVQGGLDPLVLVAEGSSLAGGPSIERGVRELLHQFKARPYIFNLGHGIVPQTPPENVARLVELVRQGAR